MLGAGRLLTLFSPFITTQKNIFTKFRPKKQNTKSILRKQEVSLGESGSFVRGKSKFPLGKVQEAEIGLKTGILGRK